MAAAGLSELGSAILAQAAGVATAAGGVATTANITALANFLIAAGTRPNMVIPLMALKPDVQLLPK